MKKHSKITLSRETLRRLDEQQLAAADGGASIPCYPPSYGPSCYGPCPEQPFSRTNCA